MLFRQLGGCADKSDALELSFLPAGHNGIVAVATEAQTNSFLTNNTEVPKQQFGLPLFLAGLFNLGLIHSNSSP